MLGEPGRYKRNQRSYRGLISCTIIIIFIFVSIFFLLPFFVSEQDMEFVDALQFERMQSQIEQGTWIIC